MAQQKVKSPLAKHEGKSKDEKQVETGSSSSLMSFIWSLVIIVPVAAAALAALGFRGRDVLLGLDLGTTNSVISVREEGVGVRPLPNLVGKATTPSIIAFMQSGDVLVGKEAEHWLDVDPSIVIKDAKRVIGREIFDEVVSHESVQHGGRIVEHPTQYRSRTTGRTVPPDRFSKLCTKIAHSYGEGNCYHEIAFAVPLKDMMPADLKKLSSHKCLDSNSLFFLPPALLDRYSKSSIDVEATTSGVPLTLDEFLDRTHFSRAEVAVYGPSAAQLFHIANLHNANSLLLATPQAVGCFVVDYMLRSAKAAVGHENIVKTMAAVPAEFRGFQRAATTEAFSRAGLTVVRLLDEPTAAALAYGLEKDPRVHSVLVFDMGGGTLDVSVLFAGSENPYETAFAEATSGSSSKNQDSPAKHRGSFTVVGTAGDNALGGEDIDACMIATMLSSVLGELDGRVQQALEQIATFETYDEELHTVDNLLPSGLTTVQKYVRILHQFPELVKQEALQVYADHPGCDPVTLRSLAEHVKITLSGDGFIPSPTVPWHCAASKSSESGAEHRLQGVVTPELFESTCGYLFDSAMIPVAQALENAGIEAEEVDEVVLVGGSSRSPFVRSRLSKRFPNLELRSTVDADLAVSLGAAAAGD